MFRLESAVPDRFGSQTTATSVFSFTFVCCCCSLFFVLVGFFPIHFQLVLMNARHIRHNQLPNSTDCVRDIFSLFSKWRVTEFMLNKYFPCRPLHNSFISITVSCKLSQKDAGRMTFFRMGKLHVFHKYNTYSDYGKWIHSVLSYTLRANTKCKLSTLIELNSEQQREFIVRLDNFCI